MTPARTVHVVVPHGFDDPLRPSGGNTYDRRLCEGLRRAGWTVRIRTVTGAWPSASRAAHRQLVRALAEVPDGSLVLVDGLVASAVPQILVPATLRLRVVVLLHMPLGPGADGPRRLERAVLSAAAAVVTTSEWSRRWVLDAYPIDPLRVVVAQPGVDAAEPADGSDHGSELLCVASVTPTKGHDVLLAALSRIADLDWRCRCVGTLTTAPAFVAGLRRTARDAGVADRVELSGPRSGAGLEAAYAKADVLVLASRAETYGMVVTEALAHGLPVVASDVGGIPEAVGHAPDGSRPGLLVPVGDVDALAVALRRWLGDADLRRRLRAAARHRRPGLADWSTTAHDVARALAGVAA
ncbi:MAG: glycosyltransferase family 4 protein [Marmoricola sp.]